MKLIDQDNTKSLGAYEEWRLGFDLPKRKSWLSDTATLPNVGSTPLDPSGHTIHSFLDQVSVSDEFDPSVAEAMTAVERQYSFVEKMESLPWLRGPAIRGTLSRGLLRYEKFLQLMKTYPGTMFLPALDIDLVLHTHQYSRTKYETDVRNLTGTFVNHSDQIGRPTLSSGENKTRRIFEI